MRVSLFREQAQNENDKIITLLETQVQELKDQITAERAEKAKILEMLSTEQDKTKMLMLQPPQKPLFSLWRLFRKGAE